MTAHELQLRLQAVRSHYRVSPWIRPREDETPLLRSWQRCANSGMRESDKVAFEQVSRSLLADIDERHVELLRSTRPETERLARSLQGTGCVVLVFNERGVIIDRLCHEASTPRLLMTASRKGINLDERCVGTTAPSIVLADGEPYLVGRDAHYCANVKPFFCVAAPIDSPSGARLGVLDITAYDSVPGFDVYSLVVDAAAAIENSLFAPSPERVLLRFHTRPELVGTSLEAIVAIDDDGGIVGANRAAARLLCMPRSALLASRCDSLFERGGHLFARGPSGLCELQTRAGLQVAGRFSGVARTPPTRAVQAHSSPAPSALTIGAPQLRSQLEQAMQAHARGSSVLLDGESGTGKRTAAAWLHAQGPARDAPLRTMEHLDEIDADASGVLLIEELADLGSAEQLALAALLQRREDSGLRVLAATSHEPSALLAAGRLHADLLRALSEMRVTLPPLREREGLPDILAAFWREAAQATVAAESAFEGEAWDALCRYTWPGNLREAKTTMQRLALAAAQRPHAPLPVSALPAHLQARGEASHAEGPAGEQTLRDLELHTIVTTLQRLNGNVSAAARQLGISRHTIYRRLGSAGADA
jgi:sigma-54 dependent transcriptional regulator, acetoin dehydrogenase operon transcriptional activator AcoR